ncbi:MAG: protein kinase [Pseudomonadota bacterium]
MSRPTQAAGAGVDRDVPSDLITAFDAMIAGERSFAEFRSDLANVLYLDFRSAEAVESFLNRRCDSGDLPQHLLKVAISDIQRICAEDVPTLIDTDRIIERRMAGERAQHKNKLPPKQPRPVRAVTAPQRPKPAAEPTPAEPAPAEPAPRAARKASAVPAVGAVLDGRFKLLERIERGSMSVVYRARDLEATDSDGIVAIKIVTHRLAGNGHALRALKEEAEKGLSIRHPSIVRYDALHRDDRLFFIAMEWLDGETLAERLDRNPGKPLDRSTALSVIKNLGAALSYVHGRGLVHADVKPGNLFLCRDGRVKLLDFGISRAHGEENRARAGFDPGVLGAATPAYASYDLLKGRGAEPADDIYSFACLIYRLCSGSRVYGQLSAVDARELRRQPAAIDSLTDGQWQLLSQALSHERGERPQDAQAFGRAFVDAGRPAPASYAVPPPLTTLDEPPRGYGGFALAAVAFLAIAFGLFAAYERFAAAGPEAPAGADPVAAASATEAVVEPRPADTAGAGRAAAGQAAGDGPNDLAIDLDAREAAVTLVPAGENDAAATAPPPGVNDRIPPSLSVLADEPFDDIALILGETGIDAAGRTALTVAESGQPLNVTLVRPVAAGPERYRFIVSSAEPGRFLDAGDRVEIRPAIVTFDAGATERSVQLVPTPNARLSPDAQLFVSVVSLDAPDELQARLTLEIIDDQLQQLATVLGDDAFGFTVNAISVEESSPAAVLTLVRANPTDTVKTVRWSLIENSARDGEDFFAPVSNVVEFGPGQRSQTILVSLISDNLPEPDESFAVAIANPAVTSALPQRVEVRIADDDFR